jgi:predicted trehalose synthase
VAAQVLVRLGGDLSAIRQQVIRLLKEKPTTEELPRAAQAAQAQAARLAESAAEAGIIGRAEGAVPAGIASPAESASLSGKLTEVLSRLDAISNRLTMIERAVGIGNAMDDD